MPRGLLRPCTYPGCPALVERGRCTKHPYPIRERERRRESAAKRGYDSTWHKKRAAKLSRTPFCEIRVKCRGAKATEVDHIKSLRKGGTHEQSNLQSACKPCHSWKTNKQDRDYTRKAENENAETPPRTPRWI